MDEHGFKRQGGLLSFVLYALAAHGDPPLTQARLCDAVVAALESPRRRRQGCATPSSRPWSRGRSLADAVGLPSPELMASQTEVVGAFGDWLRARGLVEGCGFSRSGDALTCAFRGCVCLHTVSLLRESRADAVPPCVLVGLLVALLRARGVHAAVAAFRMTDDGCEWQLDLGR